MPTPERTFHDRRLARRLQEDPEFAAEFARQQREIAAIDAIVNSLDTLREQQGMTRAALARAIDKHPAAIRRLFSASGNPELRTVVALAAALDADVQIVPRRAKRLRKQSRATARARDSTRIALESAARPEQDPRHADEILGYDDTGLPI